MLVKSTLCAIPFHISLAINVPLGVLETIETMIRGFLCCSSESASGRKCAIAWVNVACPTIYMGIGILNLKLMGMALQMYWLWLARADISRT